MAQTDLDSMNIDAILEQSEAWKASDAEATAKESDDTDLAESLLSCLESCAALKKFNEYDGVVYERPVRKPNQMLDKDDAEGFIMPDCKRVTKTRVVSVDGHSVLKWSIEEETEAEAAVAKPGCAKPAREKKFEHQFTCLMRLCEAAHPKSTQSSAHCAHARCTSSAIRPACSRNEWDGCARNTTASSAEKVLLRRVGSYFDASRALQPFVHLVFL